MQKSKFTISKIRIAGLVIALLLLVSVRFFENELFYDPFLSFFRHKGQQWPLYSALKLFLGLFFRFSLNTALSLGILWLLFKDTGIIKLCAFLYFAFFLVLAVALFIVLQKEEPNLLMVFYIRRFLIQPYLLLLFVPAFYYQKHVK